jgi:hypothetical protein
MNVQAYNGIPDSFTASLVADIGRSGQGSLAWCRQVQTPSFTNLLPTPYTQTRRFHRSKSARLHGRQDSRFEYQDKEKSTA